MKYYGCSHMIFDHFLTYTRNRLCNPVSRLSESTLRGYRVGPDTCADPQLIAPLLYLVYSIFDQVYPMPEPLLILLSDPESNNYR